MTTGPCEIGRELGLEGSELLRSGRLRHRVGERERAGEPLRG